MAPALSKYIPRGGRGGRSGGRGGDSSPSRRHRQERLRRRLRALAVFWPFKVAQVACVVYILILTFSDYPLGLVDPSSGNIVDPGSANNTAAGVIYVNGDYRPVVAVGPYQKFCLAMSRMSAFSLYPMLVLVFLTKCKALHSVFIKTPLSMFLVLNEAHDLHVYAGHYIAVDVWIHTLFHILRWADQGNVSLLWEHVTGLTGLIVVIVVPFIALPMMFWKQKIRYEIRKGLHYLFVVFAVGMCYHVPMSGIPNGGFIAPIMGSCICLYAADAIFVYLFMTEKIETTTFHVLSSGVRITMPVSEGFQRRSEKGGYAYVCLPWVDRWQWHAFSLFEDPSGDHSNRQMFMLKAGDWTEAVHRALRRSTVRPVWIQGPFPSPYNEATLYDNQILVASGIGITPALSVIRAFKSSRRINLVWAVRDPAMLEFFMEHLYLDHDGWNLIFYTGKEPLATALEEMNTNVRVIRGRPDLKAVVPNIIYGIESGAGRPETCTSDGLMIVKELLIDRMRDLDEQDGSNLTSREKVADLTAFVNGHGFSFAELLNDIREENRRRKVMSVRMLGGGLETHPEGDEGAEEDDDDVGSNCDIGATSTLREIKSFGDHEYGPSGGGGGGLGESAYGGLGESAYGGLGGGGAPPERRRGIGLRHRSSRRFGRGGGLIAADSRRGLWTAMRRTFTSDMPAADIARSLTSTFRPWVKNATAEAYVSGLDREMVLPTWGMMYCGGSAPVQETLREISEEYRISLHIDSFAW